MRSWGHVAFLACLTLKWLTSCAVAQQITCYAPPCKNMGEKTGDIVLEERGDPFLRFGKSEGQDSELEGSEKRNDPYLRFGRGDPFLRFGKRNDPYLRFGKRESQDSGLDGLEKRNDPFLRFGRGDPFLRFGKKNDPYLRFGKRDNHDSGLDGLEKRNDPYLRFGRNDPYLRFGRNDPYLRFGRNDPYLRFGKKNEPYLRFGKRNDPYLRFGKKNDPFLRFGKRAMETADETGLNSRKKRSVDSEVEHEGVKRSTSFGNSYENDDRFIRGDKELELSDDDILDKEFSRFSRGHDRSSYPRFGKRNPVQ